MDTLYIVMPAYNEDENIEITVSQWYKCLLGKGEDSRLLVSDSGSTDKTREILLSLKEEKGFDKLLIIDSKYKEHGPKLLALYDYAIKHGADYIFQTDSDGQTNPLEFENFWNQRNKYSAIFGQRDERGDGKDRAFVEDVVCILIKIIFNVRVPDANAPFRLMKASALKKYLYRMREDYNLPNIMLTTFFVYYREKYKFINISFKQRLGGENKLDIKGIIKIGIRAVFDFIGFSREMKR